MEQRNNNKAVAKVRRKEKRFFKKCIDRFYQSWYTQEVKTNKHNILQVAILR